MAKEVTINGYTFKESPSGGALITGSGIPDNSGFGIQVTSDLQNLTPVMIQGLGNIPGVTPAAAAVLSSFTQADVDTIKQALTAPPAPAPATPLPEPTPPTATDQQNRNYVSQGGANDDNPVTNQNAIGATQSEAAAINQAYADDAEINGAAALTTAGTTVAGKSNTPSAKKNTDTRKRLKNPLADFSSYSYIISLYMITPDAYNAFITSGRKNINAFSNVASTPQAQQSYTNSSSGVYLVAQSGGIDNTISNRAPGFNLDYYIDNLEINTAVSMGKSTESDGPINQSTFKFQIIEPYGFSFITKLKNAQNALQKYTSSLPNIDKNPFADRSHYILGISFLGYDSEGNLINNLSTLAGKRIQDQNANSNYQVFYDIKLQTIKFKFDGKTTVYNIEAAQTNIQAGMGLKHGRILEDSNIVGGTVGEMVSDLENQLNSYQEELEKAAGCQIKNQYEIKFIGVDAENLKKSPVVNKEADSDKTKYPILGILNTDQVNASKSYSSKIDGNQRQLLFKGQGATSIVQALKTIYTNSEFLQKPLKNLYTNEPEPDRKTDDYDTADSEEKGKELKFINVSTQIQNLGYDTYLKDWAYKITYYIQSYATPFISLATQPNITPYTGPVKRYDYLLTGQNTEVLSFEMAYDTLYTSVALANLEDQKDITYPVPTMVGHKVAEQNQGRLAAGLQTQNTYINNLMDPSAYSSARLTIMGDPDWLIQEISETEQSINDVYNSFYKLNELTGGYTINCNNGQVFIEINFKEAIDYDNNVGLMDVNENLLFFKYPKKYREGPNKIEGIAYQVNKVTSWFKSGKFTQSLGLITSFWPDTGADDETSVQANREPPTTGSFARMDRMSPTTPGLKNEPGPGQAINTETGDIYTPLSSVNASPTGQSSSPTGAANNAVADDDASGRPSKTPSNNNEGRPNLIDFNLF